VSRVVGWGDAAVDGCTYVAVVTVTVAVAVTVTVMKVGNTET
jgi:hypothetical protein